MEQQQFQEEWIKCPEACIVNDFPLSIDIELTNRCNMNCMMCPHHGPDAINQRIPQDMDFELYKKIIDECAERGLHSIKLNYGGESTLYDKLLEAIQYAKKKGIDDVRLNTNALWSDDDFTLNLIDSGIDLITVTDYHFPRQYRNIKKLSEMRDFFSDAPKIQIMLREGECDQMWHLVADEVQRNVYFEYNYDEDFTPSTFKCSQPWQRILVLASGEVCSCSCGVFIPEKVIGNAWRQSIKEIWNGKQMMFLRYCHEFGDTHLLKQCRMCPMRKEYINGVKK